MFEFIALVSVSATMSVWTYRINGYVRRTCHGEVEWSTFRPFHFHVLILGKLFTYMFMSSSSIIWYWPKSGNAVMLYRWWGECGSRESNNSLCRVYN